MLVAVKAYHDGLMVGRELKTMNEVVPKVDMRVAAIFAATVDSADRRECIIEEGDEVFFLAAREHIPTVISEMRKLEKPNKRIMLAGGGNIGGQLAAMMEKDYQVKVIEAFPVMGTVSAMLAFRNRPAR